MGVLPLQRLAFAPDARVVFWEPLGSAADRRAYFLFDGKKKVAKEKATPGYAVGCADCPALLDGPGGWLNSPPAQTTPADYPRPVSVARRSTWGPQQRRSRQAKVETNYFSAALGVPGPLGGAEQRRAFGGSRLALSEPQASLASRPNTRVAQGTREGGADPGSPSSLATFFLARQEESTPARQARNPAVQQCTPAGQRRNPANQKNPNAPASGAEPGVTETQ
jgi:hypothetical protein